MKTLSLVQGSAEWLAIRGQYLVASEAPIMMGASPFMSRDDLLKYKTTGDQQEITRFQQIIFDKGHNFEALARPIAERDLDQELYPVTGARELNGMKFLASFDGLTMMEDDHWEHKQFNKELHEIVKNLGELPPKIFWQLEHQLLVNENDSCLFSVSDGTEKNYAQCRYHSVPARRQELILSWSQFLNDLDGYVPIVVPPKAIAELVETLPALTYQTSNTEKGLSLVSNLDEYKAACVALVERSKKKIETDQDFANAENRVKLCKEAEEKITYLQKQVLGEVSDIDKFSRDLEAIKEMLRQCRLNEDKQVNQRKTEIRTEIISNVKAFLDNYIKAANEALATHVHAFGVITLPEVKADFIEAMKGKRTIKTLQEAANNELARAKVEASRIADLIDKNLILMAQTAKDYPFLFADIRQLITKDTEDLKAIAINRIAEHKIQDQARIDAEAQKIADKKIEEAKTAQETKPVIQPRAAVYSAPKQEEQPTLFGQEFVNDLAAADEYFNGAVSSPIADAHGAKTIVGRDQIVEAVSKFWGIPTASAELACIEAFEPKL